MIQRLLITLLIWLLLPVPSWAAGPDAFTGTNGTALGTYSSDWIVKFNAGDIQIESNMASPNAPVYPYDTASAYWNPATNTAADDQWAQCTLSFSGFPSVTLGVGLRLATTGVGYSVAYEPGNGWVSVYKLAVDGTGLYTNVNLGNDGTSWSGGDVLYAQIQGSTIIVKKNGTQTMTVTDATFTSGQYGLVLGGANTATGCDDWSAGDLSTAAPNFFMRRRNQ